LMMAYAIHSNVRNLGLFFIYDKVGISRWKKNGYGYIKVKELVIDHTTQQSLSEEDRREFLKLGVNL
jgi:hypothetical protein